MRYFLITYNVKMKGTDAYAVGSIWFPCSNFPSNNSIKNLVVFAEDSERSREDVVIRNIFEFKNKKDYDDFNKED